MNVGVVLWRRELSALFLSPIAYVVLMFFLLVTGFGFYWLIRQNLELMRSVQGLTIVIWGCMLIVVPALTMRLVAEERKSGTLEALLTAPVNSSQVVLAKFFGVWTFFLIMCLPTLGYPFVLRILTPDAAAMLDAGPLLGGYVTLALIAAAFLSMGLLASALTSNQIIAATATFSLMSLLFFGGLFEPHLSKTPLVREVGSYLSSALHLMEASRGVFDSRTWVLYISTTALFLTVTIKVVDARR